MVTDDPLTELREALANLSDLEARFARIERELTEGRQIASATLAKLERLTIRVDNNDS